MALSNTATPKYYGEFRRKVELGIIPVNENISMEMNRIDRLIANPDYYYDDLAVEGWIKYCEGELTLTDGSDFRMLDSFKLWGEAIFGWYYFKTKPIWEVDENGVGGYVDRVVKKRLTKKQYLIVARGAAKTMYAECIQAFFLNVDTTTTHQITTAPTMKQAEEVMSPFRTAITRSRGPFFKFLTMGSLQNTTGNRADRVKLASTKKGIENFLTNSLLEIRPMSRDKLQGLRPKVATVDEWLSGEVRDDVVGAIEQGAAKDDQEYIIVAISSEGTVRNGVGDSIKMELMKILKGEFIADHISIFHYRLDSIEEVPDPNMWPKANPNVGLTVPYEVYQQDVERAEQAPANRNDILAKRFGLPLEGFTYFFTHPETLTQVDPTNYSGMLCAMGADLSQGDDFCAFTFLFPRPAGGFGVKTRSYITRRTHDKLPMAARAKYDEFIQEHSLHVMEHPVLDMMEVYDDLEQYIDINEFEVAAFGYDPWGAQEFVARWERENGPFGVMKVIQGARTESVPLGEIKIFSEQRLLIFDQELMHYAMGNAIVLEDNNGNRKLSKMRAEEKIDNVSAMLDAYVAYKANKDAFE